MARTVAPLEQQGVTAQIERLCTEQGLRMTAQRQDIGRILSDADDHPNAEEICHRRVAVDPKMSIATVYRTLRRFRGAGIFQRLDFSEDRSRYEMVA